MITAAEKHISGDKGRQSASRGLNQLPVAYCGAKRKVTMQQAGRHRALCTSRKESRRYLLHCEVNPSVRNDTEITFIKISNYEAPRLIASPSHHCPISNRGGSFPTKRSDLGSFPTERPNLILHFKDGST